MEYGPEHYDAVYTNSSDTSRYHALYSYVATLAEGNVLDIGCGTAPLQNYITNYCGFDFSPVAVKIANNPNVWVGNAYDKSNYGDYDTYILTEVLEHLDDLKVLENIPAGKRVILSVASFLDDGHLRVYTEETVLDRYETVLDIKTITRFDCKFAEKKPFEVYILLIEAAKKKSEN